jgi:drug/metabolite transporter (DMT)-like permease
VALMSWWFLGERISLRMWGALACACAGISLVSLTRADVLAGTSTGEASRAWLGNLLLVGAVLCESAYAVIGKKLTSALSAKRITALINLWGFALITPLGAWVAWRFDFLAVTGSTWLLLGFYSMAASVWTVWLWMTGLKNVPANQAGMFTVMLPISAAGVGVLVLGEAFTSMQLAAFGMALLGVALATLPDPKADPGKA